MAYIRVAYITLETALCGGAYYDRCSFKIVTQLSDRLLYTSITEPLLALIESKMGLVVFTLPSVYGQLGPLEFQSSHSG